jgi:hypothetical protein
MYNGHIVGLKQHIGGAGDMPAIVAILLQHSTRKTERIVMQYRYRHCADEQRGRA